MPAMSASTSATSWSRISSSTSSPSSSKRDGACPTGTSASTTRAPIAASTFRSSAWAQTAPNAPVDAPHTATGRKRSGFVISGREAQSSAFFRTPGIEELYSGVAIRTPSAAESASRSLATALGGGSTSSSWSYGGTLFNPRHSSNSTPSGSSDAAASRRRELYESRRRLPEIPRIFVKGALVCLDEEELGVDRDVVAQGLVAARERRVPVHAELGPVDGRGEDGADAILAVGVRRRRRDRPHELDGLRNALDRDLALPGDLAAVDLDALCAERDLGMALRIEEIGRLEVPRQHLVLDVDARDTRAAVKASTPVIAERQPAVDVAKLPAERADEVLDLETDGRMNRIEAPSAGQLVGLRCGGGHRWSSC